MTFLGSLTREAREELVTLIRAEVTAALDAPERMPPKRWLTTAEASEYLGCSQRALHQRLRRGRIPSDAVRHQGRRLLFDRRVLDRALEAES